MTIVFMRTDPDSPKNRILTSPLACKNKDGRMEFIPVDFPWDGSSIPWFAKGIFPRHDHPIASCRHDFRCSKAKNKEDRKFADSEFKIDVRKTSWRSTAAIGYAGVRIGAFFGIGSSF